MSVVDFVIIAAALLHEDPLFKSAKGTDATET
jgi:hypothetical protein